MKSKLFSTLILLLSLSFSASSQQKSTVKFTVGDSLTQQQITYLKSAALLDAYKNGKVKEVTEDNLPGIKTFKHISLTVGTKIGKNDLAVISSELRRLGCSKADACSYYCCNGGGFACNPDNPWPNCTCACCIPAEKQ